MSMFGFPSPALPASLQIAGVSLSVYCQYHHLSVPPHLLPLTAAAARLKYDPLKLLMKMNALQKWLCGLIIPHLHSSSGECSLNQRSGVEVFCDHVYDCDLRQLFSDMSLSLPHVPLRPQAVDREPRGRVADVDGERVQPEECGLPQVLYERGQSVCFGEGTLPGSSA